MQSAMQTFALLRHETDIRSFKQGETIFNEGESGNCMFAVIEGTVAIELRGAVIEHVAQGGVLDSPAVLLRWRPLIAGLAPSTKRDFCGWWNKSRGSRGR
jgi:CRP-like cAMP-binding protein